MIVLPAFRVNTYITKSVTVQAEQWNGTDNENITALAGTENVNVASSMLQVRNTEGEWVTLYPGWWASKNDSGQIGVHSDGGFRTLFAPEE